MRILKYLLLLQLSCAPTWGSEITSQALITPVPYLENPVIGEHLASRTIIFAGKIAKIDIGDEIKKGIAPFENDLKKFFTKPNELKNLLDTLTADIKKNVIKDDLTDANVIAMYSYLGKNLIGKIADRILENQGVKDLSRRNLWIEKILVQFNSCMSIARDANFEAKHCLSALTAGLAPNLGTAIVYELSKSNLTSAMNQSDQAAFNTSQVTLYQQCLNNNFSADYVKACALDTMKKGVEKISNIKIDETLKKNSSSPVVENKIKKEVWNSYDKCIRLIGRPKDAGIPLSQQFSTCVDQLTVDTGAKLVADQVLHTKSLQQTFSKNEIEKLSQEKSSQFKSCTGELISKNLRTGGLIDSSYCTNIIVNDLTYLTVLKKFEESAVEQVKGTTINPTELKKNAKAILNKCWNSTQTPPEKESCLKKSVIEFTKVIASKRLDYSIPDSIATKQEIRSNSLQNLETCLKNSLTDNISQDQQLSEKLSPCTQALLRTATDATVREGVRSAVDTNLKDKNGMDLSNDRQKIQQNIIEGYQQCLALNDAKTNCSEKVTKDATLAIALAAGRISRNIETPHSGDPSSAFLSIEEELKTCTSTKLTGDELAKKLEKCKSKFVFDLTKNLGAEKFNTTLLGLLGNDKFNKSLPQRTNMLQKFNSCLDQIYPDAALVKTCTDQLTISGETVFKENVYEWMSTDEKDAATLEIKAQFIDFLPCLGGLLPSGGNSAIVKVEADVKPFMEILSKAIAQYIEYSPEDAKKSLDELIKQFKQDLQASSDSNFIKLDLINLLYKNGAFEQFLKSYVQKITADGLAGIPDSFLPKNLKDLLISKDNFDAIFKSTEGTKIKEKILNQLIKPIIIEGKSSTSPELMASTANITDQITQLLINSPHFGEKIISSQVQGSLDNIGLLKGLFVKTFYGGPNALDWQKVRLTSEGQAAENFIKENIMTPKFKMSTLTDMEIKRRDEEAKHLVEVAVKTYREPKK